MRKRIICLWTAFLLVFAMLPGIFAAAAEEISVSLRIEGIVNTLFYDTLEIPSAGDVTLQQAILYADEQNSDLSIVGAQGDAPYITEINGEAAGFFGGYDGWLYRVNDEDASVGMQDIVLKDGDSVVLYYGDPFGAGMQYPFADTSDIGDGVLRFISKDTTYPENEPVVTQNPVSGATVIWYDTGGVEAARYVTDENGEVTIDAQYLSAGSHRVGIERTKDDSGEVGLPTVLRLAPDYSVTVGSGESDAWWPGFRQSASNMAIVDAKTPVDSKGASLLWNSFIGSQDWSSMPGEQIIAGGSLYAVSGSTLYRMDPETGETLQKTELEATNLYSNISPLYADGMIFVALEGGVVQALDCETLETLWVYTDELGGQGQTPLLYAQGMVYTGFWNSEGKANYVALSARDGGLSWAIAGEGGYYWAGAADAGSYIVFGAEDGTLRLVLKESGEVADTFAAGSAVRSSVSQAGGRLYFTTAGGRLVSLQVGDDGSFESSYEVELGNPSTSTPVVYGGRIYVGVQGADAKSGSVAVVDEESMSVVYTVPMQGYPQNSLLLSTGYEQETGKVYLYSTYNNTPGGITLIEDSASQTSPVYQELFVPEESLQNYCIGSIICGEDGTLYYKNDSGNVFAIRASENAVLQSQEASPLPAQSVAAQGQSVDGSGTWIVVLVIVLAACALFAGVFLYRRRQQGRGR
jgi:hypothetical protein